MGFSLGGVLGGGLLGGAMGAQLGGLKDSLFGTKQGTVPFTSTTTTSPWAALSPYLTSGFANAQNVYNQQNQAGSLFNQAQGLAGQTLAGNYLTPDSNPYLKSSVEDALGLARSSFAGQYGGAAGQNLDNSGYQEALGRALGATATNAYSNAYQNERQNQMAAIPFAASLPYANLQGYLGALSPGLQFGTSTTQGEQPYYQNNTANTLGALAGGAGLLKMFSDRRLKSNIVKVGDHPKGFGIYEYDIFGRRERGVMAQEVEKVIPEAVSEFLGYKIVDYGRLY